MKKKKLYELAAMVLAFTMIGGSITSNHVTTNAADNMKVQEVQVTCAPAIGEEKFVPKEYDIPDEEELQANKKLKEVMEQWIEAEEFPEYFVRYQYYGENALYPIIQMTDITEENKKDFFQRVGIEHDKWLFVDAKYSRKEICELKDQIEKDYANDQRILNIEVSDNLCAGEGGEILGDGTIYEYRPKVEDGQFFAVEIEVKIENQIKVRNEMNEKYGEGKVRVYSCSESLDLLIPEHDINEDGKIDLADAQLALRIALRIDTSKNYTVSLEYAQDILKKALRIQ